MTLFLREGHGIRLLTSFEFLSLGSCSSTLSWDSKMLQKLQILLKKRQPHFYPNSKSLSVLWDCGAKSLPLLKHHWASQVAHWW